MHQDHHERDIYVRTESREKSNFIWVVLPKSTGGGKQGRPGRGGGCSLGTERDNGLGGQSDLK